MYKPTQFRVLSNPKIEIFHTFGEAFFVDCSAGRSNIYYTWLL